MRDSTATESFKSEQCRPYFADQKRLFLGA
jgi:hypothetical protein